MAGLCSFHNISDFEDKVEQIRDLLINGALVLSRQDTVLLKSCIKKSLVLPLVLAIARILGPLLESKDCSQDAAEMLVELLHHGRPEVRYAALEAIGYALGGTPVADTLLSAAKEILQEEKSVFVSEYLSSL